MTSEDRPAADHFKGGCFHLHVKAGQIQNGFSHLTFPDGEYVLHLKVDEVYSPQEFAASHPQDVGELNVPPKASVFDLAGGPVVAKG
jgi:hypothetical protein